MRFDLVFMGFSIRFRKCHALSLYAMGPARTPFLIWQPPRCARLQVICIPLSQGAVLTTMRATTARGAPRPQNPNQTPHRAWRVSTYLSPSPIRTLLEIEMTPMGPTALKSDPDPPSVFSATHGLIPFRSIRYLRRSTDVQPRELPTSARLAEKRSALVVDHATGEADPR